MQNNGLNKKNSTPPQEANMDNPLQAKRRRRNTCHSCKSRNPLNNKGMAGQARHDGKVDFARHDALFAMTCFSGLWRLGETLRRAAGYPPPTPASGEYGSFSGNYQLNQTNKL